MERSAEPEDEERVQPDLIPAAIRRTAKSMSARIYQRPKNAMQSGKALTDEWLLDFDPAEAKRADPLMGWAGSGDTQAQVTLKFDSQAEAKAYIEKYGIPYGSW